jgi:hypothetical protein
VASYFVAPAGVDPAQYPRDTSHGGIPDGARADFAEILERTYPAPRFELRGGFAASLAILVENEAMVDQERPTFDDEYEYLCVWDNAAKRMVECVVVGDGPNPENLPTIPATEQRNAFADLRARHASKGLLVVEVTATSYVAAVAALGG